MGKEDGRNEREIFGNRKENGMFGFEEFFHANFFPLKRGKGMEIEEGKFDTTSKHNGDNDMGVCNLFKLFINI